MKLIYIMGAGRSGTTLLDVLLGNTESTLSMGEIRWFSACAGQAPNRPEGEVKSFWQKVYADSTLDAPKSLQSVLDNHFMLPVTLLLARTNLVLGPMKSYYQELFNNASRRSRCSNLVDSSKYPSYALLHDSALNDFFLVYLVRDRKSVVRSFTNGTVDQPTKSRLMANLYYLLMNLACRFTYLLVVNKKMIVRYENLVNDPEVELSRICQTIGINGDAIVHAVKNNEPIKTGFIFQGNRMRLDETIHLKISNHRDRPADE